MSTRLVEHECVASFGPNLFLLRQYQLICKRVFIGGRWASRARHIRRCRLVLQSDSAVVVGALRKGRSSEPELLVRLRRLAALTPAERITLVGRYVPTDRNMADSPPRGPCTKKPLYEEKRNAMRPPYVRPRGRGFGLAAVRIGEGSNRARGRRTFGLSCWLDAWGQSRCTKVTRRRSTTLYLSSRSMTIWSTVPRSVSIGWLSTCTPATSLV